MTRLLGWALALPLFAVVAASAQTQPQRQTQDEATLTRGAEVYEYWCATCHSAGRGMPGTSALAVKYRGTKTPAVLEDRRDLTPQSIRFFVRQGVSVMAPFRKTEITDADLDAMIAYLLRPRP